MSRKSSSHRASAPQGLLSDDQQFQVPSTPPRGHPDYLLLNLILILVVVGLISILSASAHVAQTQMGDASHFFKRQLFGAVLGVAAMVAAMRLDIYKLALWVKPLMMIVIVLMVCVHLPMIGITAKGSSRWVNLLGFVFQPSEVAKPVLVLYIASMLGHPHYHGLNLRHRIELLVPIVVTLFLVLVEPDLGSALTMTGTVVLLYFVAGLPLWKFASIIGSGFFGVLILSLSTPYQRDRITSWLDPWADPQGTGFHLIQSMIAIGSGGLFGNGYGQSIQKLFYLPEQHTDFIFAIISEEFGFVGVLVLLVLFAALTQRGITVAYKSPTPYLKLMAAGLITMVSTQAFINLAVVSGTIPTTGITLPFISFGSSSLIVNLGAIGLLLNISRYVKHPLKQLQTT